MSTASFAQNSVHGFNLKSIDGNDLPLSAYKGKALMIVNTASKCGYTPQYTGLESVYQKYKGKGLVMLGVPANNFGGQEPGSDQEIKTFCSRKFNVTFPMASKISVKGDDQHPLFQMLAKSAGEPKWNFTKYLIGKDGKVIRKFDSNAEPTSEEVTAAIEAALK